MIEGLEELRFIGWRYMQLGNSQLIGRYQGTGKAIFYLLDSYEQWVNLDEISQNAGWKKGRSAMNNMSRLQAIVNDSSSSLKITCTLNARRIFYSIGKRSNKYS